MTRLTLTRRAGKFVRAEAVGHSGYADFGEDIVCAAVSACFRLICAQLEAAGLEPTIEQDDETALLALSAEGETAHIIFKGFFELAKELEAEYPENISLEVLQNA